MREEGQRRKPKETQSISLPPKRSNNNKQTEFILCWPISGTWGLPLRVVATHSDTPSGKQNKTKLIFHVPEISDANNSLVSSGTLLSLPSQCWVFVCLDLVQFFYILSPYLLKLDTIISEEIVN